MLYKFKSKTAGDLLMLDPNGRRVLEIIGKEAGKKGIVLPEQMPEAIARLEAAILREEAERHAADAEGGEEHSDAYDGTTVGLRHRAQPFIDLLKRCHAADSEVVWGV